MQFKITSSKAAATATTIALALSLAACASEEAAGEDSSATQAESTSEPAATTEPATQVDSIELPIHFDSIPMPEGASVVDTDELDPDGGTAAVITVPGTWEDTADFYREQLPGNGWTIDTDEPSDSGAGARLEASRDDSTASFAIEDASGATEVVIAVAPLASREDQVAGGTNPDSEGVIVDLPADFPTGIALPLFAPSTLVAGGPHGDEMWVLEYVATTDMATVGAGIEEDIALKDWTITDEAPEGPGTKYELTKPGYELILVILPERSNEADTSLHYTLRIQ